MAKRAAVTSETSGYVEIGATSPELINFFHLCRIVLEDVPDILRTLFRNKIGHKYKDWRDCPRWGEEFFEQERFRSRLRQKQIDLLKSGKTSDWDMTLLAHALLYSSHFLLANSFVDNQVILHRNNKLVSSSPQVDFTKYLRKNIMLLCDLGDQFDTNEVKYVTQTEITLKYRLKAKNSTPITLYIPNEQWAAVSDLSGIRNTHFAHCKSARIDTLSLKRVVGKIEKNYTDLAISRDCIISMKDIMNEKYGDEDMFCKIKYYQTKWQEESINYFQVKQDVDSLYSNVDEVKLALKGVEEGTQENKADSIIHHENIGKLQSGLTDAHIKVLEIATSQKGLEKKAIVMSSEIVSLESRQTSLEQKEETDIIELQHQYEQVNSHVTDTVKLVKEVSLELEITEDRVQSLEETERQISQEVEKAGDLLHQLSVKDDEQEEKLKELKDDVTDMKLGIVKVKEDIEFFQHKGPPSKLSVSYFESELEFHSEKFHAGTRQWLFDQLESMKKKVIGNRNQPNMCLITANPGMGKTIVAAKLCKTYKLEGSLAGWFFFQHHIGRKSNPKMLVQTLCHQFQSTLEGYSEIIENEVANIDPDNLKVVELFSYLVKEPLYRLPAPSSTKMVVIDALDECDFDSCPDLLKLLIREFIKLPRWIQIILTTRPDKKIVSSLKKLKCIIEILPDDLRNLADIRIFLRDFLENKISKEHLESGIELLVKKSEGMFLYFQYAIDALEEKEHVSLEELNDLLPDGIDDYYEQNFHRLFDTLGENQYQNFLQGILMAQSDFPENLVGPLLRISGEEVKKIVSMVSSLFPVHNGSICIFHKSVRDWLLDKDSAGEYAVDPFAGQQQLASLCLQQLTQLKDKFSLQSFHELCSNPAYQFVVQNVLYHVNKSNATSKALKVIEDIQFMYFRLIYTHGSTSGLIDDINESLSSTKIPKEKQLLLECHDFIRKHSHVLEGNPNLIFQCALNAPRALSERLGIHLYSPQNFPGLKVILEVVNKTEQLVPPLATFSCDDDVTSCALVPGSNVMVCSDSRGFVYYFDLKTSKALNKVDLSEEFKYPFSIHTCSISNTHKMIAYGNHKKALSFDGELVPLLRTDIGQEINTCIFSPNGEKLLLFSYYQDGLFQLLENIQFSFPVQFHLELWNVSTSKSQSLHIVKRKENRLLCACFTPSGEKIFCGYRNGIIIQWNSATCLPSAFIVSPEIVIREELPITDIEFMEGSNNAIFAIIVSKNGHFMAASTFEGLQLWDAAGLELITLQHPVMEESKYTDCSFSQDNQLLIAGTNKGFLEIFGIKDFKFALIASVKPEGSSKPVLECLFVEHSTVLCSVGNNIRIYDIDALIYSKKENCDAIHPGAANSSVILPHDDWAITLGNKQVCLWDVRKCKLVSSGKGFVGGYLLRISADGKTLLTYGDRCYIEVWDVPTLTKKLDLMHLKQRNLPIGRDDPDESSPTDICHCAVSIDGIVVGGTGNGDLFVWYGEELKLVKELDSHESLITFIEFSPSGSCFVSADMDGVVMMWKLSNRREDFRANRITLTSHTDSVEQLCFSSQGRRLVSCSMDTALHLYNGPSGDLIAKLTKHSAGVMLTTFSSGEAVIASGDERGEIILWDGMTGEILQHIKPKLQQIVRNLQFIKQDKYICSRDINAGYITIHEVATGTEVSCLSFNTEIYSMSASSHWKDDGFLLCCLKDGSVKFIHCLESDAFSLIG